MQKSDVGNVVKKVVHIASTKITTASITCIIIILILLLIKTTSITAARNKKHKNVAVHMLGNDLSS